MELGIYNAQMLRLAAEAAGAGRLAERDASAEVAIRRRRSHQGRHQDRWRAHRRARLRGPRLRATQASASRPASSRGEADGGRDPGRRGADRDDAERNGGAPEGEWADYAALEPVRAHSSRHECVMLPLRALLAALDADEPTDRGSWIGAAQGALAIAAHGHAVKTPAQAVVDGERARERSADPKKLLQHLDYRLQRAHDAGERAQHPVARNPYEVALRRFPKHAAIAGMAALPAGSGTWRAGHRIGRSRR